MERLYGSFIIGKTEISAAAAFIRDSLGQNRIQFEKQVLPNILSEQAFLNDLPTMKDGKKESLSKGNILSKLEFPAGLQLLIEDLSQPDLRLQLAGSYTPTTSELEYIYLNIYARKASAFSIGFLDNV
jgi:hypothetical protein